MTIGIFLSVNLLPRLFLLWANFLLKYRFFSIDEQLSCYCGSRNCRGIVNDTEAEERATKRYAPRSELKDWNGE